MTARSKKIFSVLSTVLIVLLLVLALLCLAVALPFKLKGEDAEIFGRQLRIVLTGSMEPTIRTDSLICVDAAPKDGEKREDFLGGLKEGDVLTFYDWSESSREEVVVTHRIQSIETGDGGIVFICRGDAADAGDTQEVLAADVIGRVEWSNYPLGKIISFLRTTAGIVLILIVPAAAILIYEVFFIMRTLRERKEEKKREEAAALEQEVERLRRELEELKTEVSEDE